MFINVALSSFTFLITTSFTAGPETLVPVDLSLVSRGELILAPGVITKVPVTFERLIGVMVSGKNCHKLNILEHENREICTFWQIWEFEIVVLSKKIIHFILMVWDCLPRRKGYFLNLWEGILIIMITHCQNCCIICTHRRVSLFEQSTILAEEPGRVTD